MSLDPNMMHTERRRVRYLGSARSGTGHLVAMRLTSVALLPLTVGFVWLVLRLLRTDYAHARLVMANPFWALLMLLFIGAGVYHMKLGMQTIIEDYVHDEHAKTWSLMLNTFFCVVVGLACAVAVLKLTFV